MNFTIGEVVTIGTVIAGVAAAFGALSHRLRAVEKQPSTSDLGVKLETIRTSQGVRLGDLEDRVSKLEGFMMGAKYRRKTKPGGEPVT